VDLNRDFDHKYGASGRDNPPPFGYRTAKGVVARAEADYRRIEDQVAEMPAQTIAGMRAKVRAAQTYLEGREIDFEDGGCPEAMARSIFTDIMRLA
jgi:hypothetical protein